MVLTVCFVLFCADCVVCMLQKVQHTRRVREAGHASRRRERLQCLEEEGVVPPRRQGARGRRADVEPDVEHQMEQENMVDDVDVHQMEVQKLEEELQAMEEEMEDAEPHRRRMKNEKVVDPEPLDDYPDGPHDTGPLWRYHVHVVRKAADGEVFNPCEDDVDICETACLCTVKSVCEAMRVN